MSYSTKLSKPSSTLLLFPSLYFESRSCRTEAGTAYPIPYRASLSSNGSIFPLLSLSYLSNMPYKRSKNSEGAWMKFYIKAQNFNILLNSNTNRCSENRVTYH